MSIRRLIVREIVHRKWNFALAVAAVAAAVGCVSAEVTLLRAHDSVTQQLLAAKEVELAEQMAALEARTRSEVAKLEDDYRKITKELGFNILILPEKQDLWNLKTLGYVTEYMPEEYAKKLARSRIVTINHLLPMVQEMVEWKEMGRRVLLTGTRGEVPLLHANPKKPLVYPVPKGGVAVGYQLHRQLKLKPGDTIQFLGRTFTVSQLHPQRGNLDDITLWVSLEEAQEILGRQGKINLMMALECNCAANDRLAEIRKEVSAILPDTQVEELASVASARAAARNRAQKEAAAAIARAKQAGEAALAAERSSREQVRGQLMAFASVLVPVALFGAVVWLGLAALANVRERKVEIGILRALGLSARSIYALFVTRAALAGAIGTVLGGALGVLAGALLAGDVGASARALAADPLLLVATIAAAPLLAVLVGWMAATLAVREDPAAILQHA